MERPDSGYGNSQNSLLPNTDPQVPLSNLTALRRKMDSLHQFLAESVDRNMLLSRDQMDMVSSEITSAIHQIIVNGAALLSCSQPPSLRFENDGGDTVPKVCGEVVDQAGVRIGKGSLSSDLISSSDRNGCGIGGSVLLSPLITYESIARVGNSSRVSISSDLMGCSYGNVFEIEGSAPLNSIANEESVARIGNSSLMSISSDLIGSSNGNVCDVGGSAPLNSTANVESVAGIGKSSVISMSSNLIDSSDKKRCEIGGSDTLSYFATVEASESVDLMVQSSYQIKEQFNEPTDVVDFKDDDVKGEIEDGECEIVELDTVELLAEHIHTCEICGKGFKRDANLRMHMRAHGNKFKTPEALAKPDKSVESSRRIRFSCPFEGCNRNKSHKRFKPLKSAICVKNHFKRSHCPKMFSCHLCNKKSFSVVADLRSHLRHCGASKWRCSCGTSFSRKDKLFGHVALFEGHMPAFAEDDDQRFKMEEGEDREIGDSRLDSEIVRSSSDNGFFDRLLEGFGSIDDVCFKDVFGSPGLIDKEEQELNEIL